MARDVFLVQIHHTSPDEDDNRTVGVFTTYTDAHTAMLIRQPTLTDNYTHFIRGDEELWFFKNEWKAGFFVITGKIHRLPLSGDLP